MGTLYVVATPIGNLEDLPPRARRVLGEVDAIASEDTRHTGMFLRRLGIERPQISYHAFNEASRIDQLLDLLDDGDLALVTDAGTPGVSDPGALLVRAVANAGHRVVPVPGPSSLAAAMSVAGFAASPVLFFGFLPKKAGERSRGLREAIASGAAVYLFESPRRVVDTLSLVEAIEPEREVVVFRELTKLHEEIVRGRAADIRQQFQLRGEIKGEIVIGIAPAAGPAALAADRIDELIEQQLAAGASLSETAKAVAAESGVPRSEIYDRARQIRSGES